MTDTKRYKEAKETLKVVQFKTDQKLAEAANEKPKMKAADVIKKGTLIRSEREEGMDCKSK